MSTENHQFRSGCSIARSLEIIGDKWTLLVVRDLLWHGKRTFRELQTSDETIPTNLLSERLRRLMAWDIIERTAYQEKPVRYLYQLADSGLALEPVLIEVMRWGHSHLKGGLFDPVTGKTLANSAD